MSLETSTIKETDSKTAMEMQDCEDLRGMDPELVQRAIDNISPEGKLR